MVNKPVNATLVFRMDYDCYSVRNLDIPRAFYQRLTSCEPTRSYRSWELLEGMSVMGLHDVDDFYLLTRDGNEFAIYRNPMTPGILAPYNGQGSCYHGSLESVLDTLDPKDTQIDIMWDDLRPETQARIERMLGENGNFDVFPIHTVYAPEDGPSMELS